MAMLEVHDGRGRVDYVSLTREHPALFGSDPKCDIVLHGEGVLPFHGRLRWKETKYKVEATPESKFVLLNGRKVVSATVRVNDEIRIGPCLIYMTEADEATEAPPPPATATPTGKARPYAEPLTPVTPPPRLESASPPRPKPRKPAPSPPHPDWTGGMEMAPPSMVQVPAAEPFVMELDDSVVPDAEVQIPESAAQPAPAPAGPRPSAAKRFLKALLAGEQAPGQERVATSPLVVLLASTLILIMALSFGLWRLIRRANIERSYNEAVDTFNDADYRNAIPLFADFLKNNPEDTRVDKLRVLQSASRVRQHSVGATNNWPGVIEEAKKMIDDVGKLPEYRDESQDIAEVVLKAAWNIAERARTTADPKVLEEARAAGQLHERIAGKSAKDLQGRSPYPARMAQARAAVDKARIRNELLAAMDRGLAAKSAPDVYKARDRLVAQYPDQAKDKAVVQKMTGANELLRAAVTYDPARRSGETVAFPEMLGPATSLVLRLNPGAAARTAPNSPIVYALAEGFAVGLDGAGGKPLWQVPVGLSSPFTPIPLRGDESAAIAFDARHDELVRLDGRTGKVTWRQGTGGPVYAPPLVAGNQLVQVTSGGKVLLINIGSGELQGTIDMGRPLVGTPVTDENGRFFYITADQAVLYVIAREDLKCVNVEYLGHAPGSIPCAPARVGRYLIVPENHTPDSGRWNVLLLEDEGAKLRQVQQVPLSGWTWDTPAATQTAIWETGDRSGVSAYAIGPYNQADPFKKIAGLTPEALPSGPAFGRLKSNNELWLSSGLSGRYDLDPERGTIKAAWTLREAGPALAPVQATDRLAVLTQQYSEGPGVALWGVDAINGAVSWRTVLGVPWPVDPTLSADGSGIDTVASNGRPLPITRAQLARGGFIEQALPKPGAFSLPTGPLKRLEVPGLTVIVPAPDASHLLVREGAGAGEFRRIDLPAPLDAPPLLLGGDIFVPAAGGRAFLIDPKTGLSRAEPFLAPFDRARPTHWRAPAKLADDAVALADDTGKVRRIARKAGGGDDPRTRLVSTFDISLGKPLAADPAAAGEALILATTDGKVHARFARDLSPMGTWDLRAPRVLGPVSAGDHAFLADAAGTVMALGPDGRKAWETDLGGVPPVGAPVVREGSVLFVGRDGTLHRLNLADGKESEAGRVALGLLPAGGPRPLGADVVVPVAPGSLRLLDAKATEVARP